MNEMLERAAQQIIAGFEGKSDANAWAIARAALLAALDPEDAVMMEVIRGAIWHMHVMSDTGSFAAREVVARLRDHIALGERTVSEDQGRKD